MSEGLNHILAPTRRQSLLLLLMTPALNEAHELGLLLHVLVRVSLGYGSCVSLGQSRILLSNRWQSPRVLGIIRLMREIMQTDTT